MAQLVALSMVGLLTLASGALAHEVNPAIADLTVEDGQLELSLFFNGEAYLSGIDLDGIADTNEDAASGDYDALRALPEAEVETRLRAALPALVEAFALTADGVALEPEIAGLDTFPGLGDTGPRESLLRLVAAVPDGTEAVAMSWPRGMGTLILRQQGVEDPYTGTLTGGDTSGDISLTGGAAPGGWWTFLVYILVGFEHIVPLGFDHILFVLGLFFLAPRLRPLLWQVSAFTVAHTITLALATTGTVNVVPEIVEPLIALSIVYVAVENLFTDGLSRWRPVLIFGFGLLHGLGFATVLGEFGLPPGQFVPALLGFNIGVEFGQLVVIGVALLLSLAALRASRIAGMETPVVYGYIGAAIVFGGLIVLGPGVLPEVAEFFLAPFLLPFMVLSLLCAVCVAASSVGTEAYRMFVAIPASLAIAAVGLYWFIERVFF